MERNPEVKYNQMKTKTRKKTPIRWKMRTRRKGHSLETRMEKYCHRRWRSLSILSRMKRRKGQRKPEGQEWRHTVGQI